MMIPQNNDNANYPSAYHYDCDYDELLQILSSLHNSAGKLEAVTQMETTSPILALVLTNVCLMCLMCCLIMKMTPLWFQDHDVADHHVVGWT